MQRQRFKKFDNEMTQGEQETTASNKGPGMDDLHFHNIGSWFETNEDSNVRVDTLNPSTIQEETTIEYVKQSPITTEFSSWTEQSMMNLTYCGVC